MDVGSGLERDEPDLRDYAAQEVTSEVLLELPGRDLVTFETSAELGTVDLSEYCLPVRDQGKISDCVAQASVNMIGCVHRRKYSDKDVGPRSVRFLYWTTRKLMGRTGNTNGKL